MAFVTDMQIFDLGIIRWVRAAIEDNHNAAAKRRVYRKTFAELNNLSNRELDDIGVGRDNIADIAADAAYGK